MRGIIPRCTEEIFNHIENLDQKEVLTNYILLLYKLLSKIIKDFTNSKFIKL